MKVTIILVPLMFLLLNHCLHAQTKSDSVVKFQEVGMNMTPLLMEVVPFKTPTNRIGPYNFIYKSYKGNTAFRAGIGLNLNDVVNNHRFIHINTRIGIEKRKQLYKNWYLNGGIDAIGFVGGFNLPGDVVTNGIFGFNNNNPDIGAGVGLTMGVEYCFNSRISLSTESMFFLGLRSTTILGFDIVPPVGLFLNFKLY